MKSLLIIGAGFGQLPAIIRAQEMGLFTVCIDRNENAVGMSLANASYVVDVLDKEGALAIAERHQINGVMTMQSDLPVPTIGFINERLGLVGMNYNDALACSNKIITRKRLAEFNCDQPLFRVITKTSEALSAAEQIGYPCIIKAPDSSGSRGVVKVNAADEVEAAVVEAFKYSKDKRILVEEYIDGLEFGAQTFSVGGKCVKVLLHNDTLSSPPYMVPTGHSFPFKELEPHEISVAESAICQAVEALGINDGPANIDLILDRNTGEVKIIEIGARIGATCLPELVSYHSGIDWVGETINAAIGNPPELSGNKNRAVAAFILESPRDGKLLNYDVPDISDSRLLEVEVTAKIGDQVSRLRKGTDRIGKVICTGENVEQAEHFATLVRDQIKFFVG